MSEYYCVIVFLTIAMMVTSIIHLVENETLLRRTKNKLILIAVLIIVGALCEFLVIRLNEFPEGSRYVHGFIKAIELTVAPIIPICYVKIVENRNLGKYLNFLTTMLLVINAFCELISVFWPFVFFIDDNNVYKHGVYYLIYEIANVSGIVIFIVALLKYTKKYQTRNVASLISLIFFLFCGLSMHVIADSVHTIWLIIAITLLMFIIYYSDISLKVDALTNLLNRKSYENKLKKLDYATAIIILDVNDFKQVNDNYGHQCGDAVLKIIAKNILNIYGKHGFCYRIGGDEFCVILKPGVIEYFSKENPTMKITAKLDELNKSLDELLNKSCETYPMIEAGVSKGYAIFSGLYDDDLKDDENNHYTLTSVKETVKLADERMYENKRKGKEK